MRSIGMHKDDHVTLGPQSQLKEEKPNRKTLTTLICRLSGVNLKIKFGNLPNTFPQKIYLHLQVQQSVEAQH